jgi:DNA topoisomerase-1
VRVSGATLKFRFRGKSGKEHEVDVTDRRLAAIVKRSRDLPGYELFQYVDEQGEKRSIESADVNEYLRTVGGREFTAKDFRTWAGTVLAAQAFQDLASSDSRKPAKRHVVRAVESVAKRLGNTTAICRKCYIHPAIIDAYLDGSLRRTLAGRMNEMKRAPRLRPEEAAVLTLLQKRLGREASKANGRLRHGQSRLHRQLKQSLKQTRTRDVRS